MKRVTSILKGGLFLGLLTCISLPAISANRTWTGAGAGGAGTDFNSPSNWTGSGALLAVDNLTMPATAAATITLSANVTINDLTVTMNLGSGISYFTIDANGFTLTSNGTATFTGVQYINGSNSDFVELDASSSGAGFVFNGNVDFNSTGDGDFHFEADITNPGTVTINANATFGNWCYTTPNDEPNFAYDGTGTQTITCDQLTSYTMGESVTVGVTNSPTVNMVGSTTRLHVYEDNLTIGANSTLDLADGGMDNFLGGGVLSLGAGAELRIGGIGLMCGDNTWSDFGTYTLDPTSTVDYYGTTQTIKGTNVAYGHLELAGSGTKTSGSNFSVAGNFTNNATNFAHGSDTHTFNGSGAQNISGTQTPTTFSTFVVNKSGGTLTSAINLDIDAELQMDAGTFLLDAETVNANNIIDINGGVLQVSSGTLNQNENSDTDFDQDGGTMLIDGGVVNIGTIASDELTDYNLDGGTLTLSSGTLNISDKLDMDGGTLNVSGTGVMNIAAFTGSGSGSTGSKFDVSAGTSNITGGTINVLGAFDNTSANPAINYNPTSSTVTGGTIVASETGSNDESFFIQTNGNNLYNFTVNKTTSGTATTTLYNEDFEDLSQGTETDAGATAWTTNCTSGSSCGLNDGSSNDYFQVRSNSSMGGSRCFIGRDMDNEARWVSQSITITGYSNVSVSVDLRQANYDNGSDYVHAYYSLDGGAEIALTNGIQSGLFSATTATVSGLSGSTIQVIVYIFNNGGNDQGRFDNIVVSGESASSATSVSLADNLDLNGDLNISNGALDVTSSNRSINLFGNWTNDDTFIEHSGTVTFDGSGNQQLTSGGTEEAFHNVVMQNTNATGLTLNDNMRIANLMTFNDGVVNPAAAELVIFSSGADATAQSDASHVDGVVRKEGAQDFEFPVGDQGVWAPIEVDNLSGSTNFDAQYFFTAHANSSVKGGADLLQYRSDIEYWDLTPSGAVTANVTLHWKDAARSFINTFNSDLVVAHYDNGNSWWEDYGQDAITAGAVGRITANAISNYSPFTFGSITADLNINPLPIELISFEAHKNDNTVDLGWTTASETNNAYFVIEKSTDGNTFFEILSQPGAGNSSSTLHYVDVDTEPVNGWNYYKLVQYDYDQTSSESDVKSVFFQKAGNESVVVYPNPAKDYIKLSVQSDLESEGQVEIYSAAGKLVYNSRQYSNGVELINTSQWASGIYSIRISINNTVINEKLIINK